MHDARNRAGYRGQGVGKMAAGQNHTQTGVLHANLNRNRASHRCVVAEEAGHQVTEQKPTGMHQPDRSQKPETTRSYGFGILAHNACHNQGDAQDRCEGGHRQDPGHRSRRQGVQYQTGHHRKQYDLERATQKPPRINVYPRTREQLSEERRHHHRSEGRTQGHHDRKRDIGAS